MLEHEHRDQGDRAGSTHNKQRRGHLFWGSVCGGGRGQPLRLCCRGARHTPTHTHFRYSLGRLVPRGHTPQSTFPLHLPSRAWCRASPRVGSVADGYQYQTHTAWRVFVRHCSAHTPHSPLLRSVCETLLPVPYLGPRHRSAGVPDARRSSSNGTTLRQRNPRDPLPQPTEHNGTPRNEQRTVTTATEQPTRATERHSGNGTLVIRYHSPRNTTEPHGTSNGR